MSMFRLDCDGGDDVECMECHTAYSVEWSTEYGDPCIGEHKATCPICRKEIAFGVYIQYAQYRPKEVKEPKED